jgi:hypothetical protein
VSSRVKGLANEGSSESWGLSDSGLQFDPGSVGAARPTDWPRLRQRQPRAGAPATVSFSVSGPEIYFVKAAAAGAGNCTLGAECTLSTALANIGASTNTRIYINDGSGCCGNVGVTLNSGGLAHRAGRNRHDVRRAVRHHDARPVLRRHYLRA